MILKNPRNISGRISRLNNALMIWSKTDLLRSLIFTGKKKPAGTSKRLTTYTNYLKILSEIFQLIRVTRQSRQRR